jgi:hypothetical protein
MLIKSLVRQLFVQEFFVMVEEILMFVQKNASKFHLRQPFFLLHPLMNVSDIRYESFLFVLPINWILYLKKRSITYMK